MNNHLLYLKSLNEKKIDVRNPSADLGQVQKCSGGKPVNGIPNAPIDNHLDLHRKYMYKQTIINMHIFPSTQKDRISSQKMKDSLCCQNATEPRILIGSSKVLRLPL